MKKLLKFRKNQDGATAIEYGLIAGLVAVVIIGGATLAGGELGTTFDTVGGSLQDANTNAGQ